jgi:hypothetical protein
MQVKMTINEALEYAVRPPPVAFAVFADNGNIRIWSTSPDDINYEISEF